eukprot:4444622-Prymnesium_polylepis.2
MIARSPADQARKAKAWPATRPGRVQRFLYLHRQDFHLDKLGARRQRLADRRIPLNALLVQALRARPQANFLNRQHVQGRGKVQRLRALALSRTRPLRSA